MRITKLTGAQWKQFTDALLDAFPEKPSLARAVQFGPGIEKSLDAIAGGVNLTDVVFNLIKWAQAYGKLEELISAASNENPGNPALQEFAESLNLTSGPEPKGQEEQVVLKSVRFKDVAKWRQRLGEVESTVCRVEVEGNGFGTGFLIGPSAVMTNYHVVKSVIQNPTQQHRIALRFDYKTLSDGTALNSGQVFKLVNNNNWLLDSSPADDLDYALLNVKGDPGSEPVGGQQGAPARGWLKPEAHTFENGEPLIIIQHPEATPLKITIGSVLRSKTNQNRVYYSANTLPGSSGSPCFTSDWELVALHRYGDAAGNEGVIFSAIIEMLRQKNLID